MASLRGSPPPQQRTMVFNAQLSFRSQHRRLGRRCSWSGLAGCSCRSPRRLCRSFGQNQAPVLSGRRNFPAPFQELPSPTHQLGPLTAWAQAKLQDAQNLRQRCSIGRLVRRCFQAAARYALRARTSHLAVNLWGPAGFPRWAAMPARARDRPALVEGRNGRQGSRKALPFQTR